MYLLQRLRKSSTKIIWWLLKSVYAFQLAEPILSFISPYLYIYLQRCHQFVYLFFEGGVRTWKWRGPDLLTAHTICTLPYTSPVGINFDRCPRCYKQSLYSGSASWVSKAYCIIRVHLVVVCQLGVRPTVRHRRRDRRWNGQDVDRFSVHGRSWGLVCSRHCSRLRRPVTAGQTQKKVEQSSEAGY